MYSIINYHFYLYNIKPEWKPLSLSDLIKTKYSLSLSPTDGEYGWNKDDTLIICRVGKAAVKGDYQIYWNY